MFRCFTGKGNTVKVQLVSNNTSPVYTVVKNKPPVNGQLVNVSNDSVKDMASFFFFFSIMVV